VGGFFIPQNLQHLPIKKETHHGHHHERNS
jgi:hypothetical protein